MTHTSQTNITVTQDADGTMGISTVHTENGKKVLAMDEYISREETIKRIKECYCTGCNSYNGVRCRACGTGDAIDMIEDTTAADVAPVVHGRWVGDSFCKWQCNKCHAPAPKYGYPVSEFVRSSYCPNCGADMRGSNDE